MCALIPGEPHTTIPSHADAIPESATGAVSRNIAFVSLATAFAKILSFAALAVLSIYLTPSDWAVIGIISVVSGIVGLVCDAGIGSAAIASKGEANLAIGVASLSRYWISGIAAVAVLLSGQEVANFFGHPDGGWIVRLSGLTALTSAIGTFPRLSLTRELNFRLIALSTTIQTAVSAFIQVGLVIGGTGPLSFLVGLLAGQTAGGVILWKYSRAPTQLVWDPAVFQSLVHFARHIILVSVMVQVFTTVDLIAVSQWAGPLAVGFYTFAMRWGSLPSILFSGPVTTVLFPTLAKISRESGLAGLTSRYLSLIRVIHWLILPIAIMGPLFVPSFVRWAFGSRWEEAIPILQLLLAYGAISAMTSTNSIVFLALGRPEFMTKQSAITLGVMAISLPPLTIGFGAIGAASSVLISGLVAFVLVTRYACGLLDINAGRGFGEMIRPLVGSMASAVPVILTFFFLSAINWLVVPSAVLAASTYATYSWVFNRAPASFLVSVLRGSRYGQAIKSAGRWLKSSF